MSSHPIGNTESLYINIPFRDPELLNMDFANITLTITSVLIIKKRRIMQFTLMKFLTKRQINGSN